MPSNRGLGSPSWIIRSLEKLRGVRQLGTAMALCRLSLGGEEAEAIYLESAGNEASP